MELIINATLLLTAIVLWIYGQYWRKKCGKVLCQYAAAYDEREDREKPLRQAIIAGNPHAPLLYALTCPELFESPSVAIVLIREHSLRVCRLLFSQTL